MLHVSLLDSAPWHSKRQTDDSASVVAVFPCPPKRVQSCLDERLCSVVFVDGGRCQVGTTQLRAKSKKLPSPAFGKHGNDVVFVAADPLARVTAAFTLRHGKGALGLAIAEHQGTFPHDTARECLDATESFSRCVRAVLPAAVDIGVRAACVRKCAQGVLVAIVLANSSGSSFLVWGNAVAGTWRSASITGFRATGSNLDIVDGPHGIDVIVSRALVGRAARDGERMVETDVTSSLRRLHVRCRDHPDFVAGAPGRGSLQVLLDVYPWESDGATYGAWAVESDPFLLPPGSAHEQDHTCPMHVSRRGCALVVVSLLHVGSFTVQVPLSELRTSTRLPSHVVHISNLTTPMSVALLESPRAHADGGAYVILSEDACLFAVDVLGCALDVNVALAALDPSSPSNRLLFGAVQGASATGKRGASRIALHAIDHSTLLASNGSVWMILRCNKQLPSVPHMVAIGSKCALLRVCSTLSDAFPVLRLFQSFVGGCPSVDRAATWKLWADVLVPALAGTMTARDSSKCLSVLCSSFLAWLRCWWSDGGGPHTLLEWSAAWIAMDATIRVLRSQLLHRALPALVPNRAGEVATVTNVFVLPLLSALSPKLLCSRERAVQRDVTRGLASVALQHLSAEARTLSFQQPHALLLREDARKLFRDVVTRGEITVAAIEGLIRSTVGTNQLSTGSWTVEAVRGCADLLHAVATILVCSCCDLPVAIDCSRDVVCVRPAYSAALGGATYLLLAPTPFPDQNAHDDALALATDLLGVGDASSRASLDWMLLAMGMSNRLHCVSTVLQLFPTHFDRAFNGIATYFSDEAVAKRLFDHFVALVDGDWPAAARQLLELETQSDGDQVNASFPCRVALVLLRMLRDSAWAVSPATLSVVMRHAPADVMQLLVAVCIRATCTSLVGAAHSHAAATAKFFLPPRSSHHTLTSRALQERQCAESRQELRDQLVACRHGWKSVLEHFPSLVPPLRQSLSFREHRGRAPSFAFRAMEHDLRVACLLDVQERTLTGLESAMHVSRAAAFGKATAALVLADGQPSEGLLQRHPSVQYAALALGALVDNEGCLLPAEVFQWHCLNAVEDCLVILDRPGVAEFAKACLTRSNAGSSDLTDFSRRAADLEDRIAGVLAQRSSEGQLVASVPELSNLLRSAQRGRNGQAVCPAFAAEGGVPPLTMHPREEEKLRFLVNLAWRHTTWPVEHRGDDWLANIDAFFAAVAVTPSRQAEDAAGRLETLSGSLRQALFTAVCSIAPPMRAFQQQAPAASASADGEERGTELVRQQPPPLAAGGGLATTNTAVGLAPAPTSDGTGDGTADTHAPRSTSPPLLKAMPKLKSKPAPASAPPSVPSYLQLTHTIGSTQSPVYVPPPPPAASLGSRNDVQRTLAPLEVQRIEQGQGVGTSISVSTPSVGAASPQAVLAGSPLVPGGASLAVNAATSVPQRPPATTGGGQQSVAAPPPTTASATPLPGSASAGVAESTVYTAAAVAWWEEEASAAASRSGGLLQSSFVPLRTFHYPDAASDDTATSYSEATTATSVGGAEAQRGQNVDRMSETSSRCHHQHNHRHQHQHHRHRCSEQPVSYPHICAKHRAAQAAASATAGRATTRGGLTAGHPGPSGQPIPFGTMQLQSTLSRQQQQPTVAPPTNPPPINPVAGILPSATAPPNPQLQILVLPNRAIPAIRLVNPLQLISSGGGGGAAARGDHAAAVEAVPPPPVRLAPTADVTANPSTALPMPLPLPQAPLYFPYPPSGLAGVAVPLPGVVGPPPVAAAGGVVLVPPMLTAPRSGRKERRKHHKRHHRRHRSSSSSSSGSSNNAEDRTRRSGRVDVQQPQAGNHGKHSVKPDTMQVEDVNRLYYLLSDEVPLRPGEVMYRAADATMRLATSPTFAATAGSSTLTPADQVKFHRFVDDLMLRNRAASGTAAGGAPGALTKVSSPAGAVNATAPHDEFLKQIAAQQTAMFQLQQEALQQQQQENAALVRRLVETQQQQMLQAPSSPLRALRGATAASPLASSFRQASFDGTATGSTATQPQGLTALQQARLVEESMDYRRRVLQLSEELAKLQDRVLQQAQQQQGLSSGGRPSGIGGGAAVPYSVVQSQQPTLPPMVSVGVSASELPSATANALAQTHAQPLSGGGTTPLPNSAANLTLAVSRASLRDMAQDLQRISQGTDALERTSLEAVELLKRSSMRHSATDFAAEQQASIEGLRKRASEIQGQLLINERLLHGGGGGGGAGFDADASQWWGPPLSRGTPPPLSSSVANSTQPSARQWVTVDDDGLGAARPPPASWPVDGTGGATAAVGGRNFLEVSSTAAEGATTGWSTNDDAAASFALAAAAHRGADPRHHHQQHLDHHSRGSGAFEHEQVAGQYFLSASTTHAEEGSVAMTPPPSRRNESRARLGSAREVPVHTASPPRTQFSTAPRVRSASPERRVWDDIVPHSTATALPATSNNHHVAGPQNLADLFAHAAASKRHAVTTAAPGAAAGGGASRIPCVAARGATTAPANQGTASRSKATRSQSAPMKRHHGATATAAGRFAMYDTGRERTDGAGAGRSGSGLAGVVAADGANGASAKGATLSYALSSTCAPSVEPALGTALPFTPGAGAATASSHHSGAVSKRPPAALSLNDEIASKQKKLREQHTLLRIAAVKKALQAV